LRACVRATRAVAGRPHSLHQSSTSSPACSPRPGLPHTHPHTRLPTPHPTPDPPTPSPTPPLHPPESVKSKGAPQRLLRAGPRPALHPRVPCGRLGGAAQRPQLQRPEASAHGGRPPPLPPLPPLPPVAPVAPVAPWPLPARRCRALPAAAWLCWRPALPAAALPPCCPGPAGPCLPPLALPGSGGSGSWLSFLPAAVPAARVPVRLCWLSPRRWSTGVGEGGRVLEESRRPPWGGEGHAPQRAGCTPLLQVVPLAGWRPEARGCRLAAGWTGRGPQFSAPCR
jgi:hypothetical protein